jgi:hypothetical protein
MMTRMLTAAMSGRDRIWGTLLNATVHVKSDQVEVWREELEGCLVFQTS